MDSDENILRRFEILGRVANWDSGLALAADRWLANFDDHDRPAARDLLSAFVFVDGKSVDAMFRAAFGSLASAVCSLGGYSTAATEWQDFRDNVLVTFPTGEHPNPSDSGYMFQRKTRQLMEIDQSQIVEPSEAVLRLNQSGGVVVFVDDIVGTGQQFLKTWQRPYPYEGNTLSFADITSEIVAYYVPLFSTKRGAQYIHAQVPELNLMPVHWLDDRYSANSVESVVWTEVDQADGVRMVERYSHKLGITSPWGHGDFGLCLGFEHAIPDLTTPILHWETDDWSPFVRLR